MLMFRSWTGTALVVNTKYQKRCCGQYLSEAMPLILGVYLAPGTWYLTPCTLFLRNYENGGAENQSLNRNKTWWNTFSRNGKRCLGFTQWTCRLNCNKKYTRYANEYTNNTPKHIPIFSRYMCKYIQDIQDIHENARAGPARAAPGLGRAGPALVFSISLVYLVYHGSIWTYTWIYLGILLVYFLVFFWYMCWPWVMIYVDQL